MSKNLNAGIGDPYWYEWSIGLLYTLDMLIPEKNIKHVILQCSAMQGLDDVVIVYNDNQIEGIQIKHTRESDTLTFSDVTSGGLIKSMSDDWENAIKQGYFHCTAILFTNRSIGTRKSTSQDGTKMPSLEDFWSSLQEQISEVKTIDEIKFKYEWEDAWQKLLAEISNFSNEKKLGFLKDLRLITNQEGLLEIYKSIVNKLMQCFRVDERTAIQLHQKLAYALMVWTTTIREKEKISKEDLLQALSLSGDKIIGDHNLPTCEPFFESRKEFVKTLEPILAERQSPIVFLSGGPGSGKTNIVNYLSNKSDSVITLRFHAFKPLAAEDEYLSADKGISDPRVFWGNLLIELRELFMRYGVMASHNVPPTIEMLESVEALRSEVLRLSEELGLITARTTVIAIDGIDHAARSGEANTFLSTLIPPEVIPNHVCFFIVGQPVSEYREYPYFLADTGRVLTFDVPSISEDDVIQLYDSSNVKIPVDGREAAIRLIYNVSMGNTLSAVFAIQEAKTYKSVEDLESQLATKHLASGIESYYNYIWKTAIESIPPQYAFIDMMLAGTLSLFNKQITPSMLSSICPDAGLSLLAWRKILQKLYPIAVNTANDGYVVFHNDVRIYLGKYIRKEPRVLSEVSSRLADYLLSGSCDVKTKHELSFDFLQNANREKDFIDVFTRQYVTEALTLKRPMSEIMAQLEATLKSLDQISDYTKVLSLSCAVATLHQFRESLKWMDQRYLEELVVPSALNSERKVIQREFLTVDILYDMLSETMFLLKHGEMARAESNLKRWLGTLDPQTLAELLNANYIINSDTESFEEDLASMLELWGRVSQHTGVFFSITTYDEAWTEEIKQTYANFAKGWLAAGKEFLTIERIKNTLGQLNIYYQKDLNDYVMSILGSQLVEAIQLLFNCGFEDQYSNAIKLQLTVWALQHDFQNFCSEWISEIQNQRFSYINKSVTDLKRDLFPHYCRVIYVLAYCETIDLNQVTKDCLFSFSGQNFSPMDRGYFAAVQYIQINSFLGRLNRCLNDGDTSSIHVSEFSNVIGQLLDYTDRMNRFDVSGFDVETDLLNSIIQMYSSMNADFRNVVDLTFSKRAKDFANIEHLDIYWNHLSRCGEIDLLKQLFEKWMKPEGFIWGKELHEINEISKDFITKAIELGWIDRVTEAQQLLNSRVIGYVGRKEYSLYSLLNWYQRLCLFEDHHWRTAGVTLLNISNIASETGDNRAAVLVDASVAGSAGRMGADQLWKFANLKNQWDEHWIGVIFDGIIAALEINDFTEDELNEIWDTATNIFYISEYATRYNSRNNINRIYIADIKEAIIRAASRLGLHDISSRMHKRAPLAFSQTRTDDENYIIPRRWYEEKLQYNEKVVNKYSEDIKELSCKDSFTILLERFKSNKSDFRWDLAILFVNNVEQQLGEDMREYIPPLFDMLMQRHDAYNWEWDGAQRLFEVLFKYLEEEQFLAVLKDIVQKHLSYNLDRHEINLYGLNNDLENFSFFYFERFPAEANTEGFGELSSMHIDWITGNQTIPMEKKYSLNPEITAKDWIEFCRKLMAEKQKHPI